MKLKRQQLEIAFDVFTAEVLSDRMSLAQYDTLLRKFQDQGYSLKVHSEIYRELLEEWKSLQPDPSDEEDLP